MKRVLAFALLAATSGAQQPAAGGQPSLPPASRAPLGALDRATAARNARHDNTRYDSFFRKYSKRYFGVGFDWQLFKAQGMAESELNAAARSYVGARGVMQLMPSTYQEIQSKRPEFQSIDDPEWNIAAGIMHDRYLWRLWEPVGGRLRAAEVHVRQLQRRRGDDHARHGDRARQAARRVALAEHRARRTGSSALAVPRDARLREEDR